MPLCEQLAEAEDWSSLCRDAYNTDPTPSHQQLWLEALADLRRIRDDIAAA